MVQPYVDLDEATRNKHWFSRMDKEFLKPCFRRKTPIPSGGGHGHGGAAAHAAPALAVSPSAADAGNGEVVVAAHDVEWDIERTFPVRLPSNVTRK